MLLVNRNESLDGFVVALLCRFLFPLLAISNFAVELHAHEAFRPAAEIDLDQELRVHRSNAQEALVELVVFNRVKTGLDGARRGEAALAEVPVEE